MEKIMLDPRQEIMEMIHGVRESLNALEMKLWEIPHHEPVEEYEEVFVAPAVGDYMHPSTPTHPCPEGLGDGAYWDECCQCWMQPNEYDWDDSNLLTNYHTDMTYLPEHGNVWVEESANDWSNSYADDWYVAPTEIVEEYVEPVPAPAPMPAHDEVHYETTDNGNTIDAPGMVPAPVMEDAPEPEMVPAPVDTAHVEMHEEVNVETAPMPEDMPMDSFQQAGTDAPQDGPDYSDTDAIQDVFSSLQDDAPATDDGSAPTT
jgi:hypothetical protein